MADKVNTDYVDCRQEIEVRCGKTERAAVLCFSMKRQADLGVLKGLGFNIGDDMLESTEQWEGADGSI